MGVIQTDQWLEKNFDHPEKICEKIKDSSVSAKEFYKYLQSFGMYRPSVQTRQIYKGLKSMKAWEIVNKFEEKYRKLWNSNGADIYIFPMQAGNLFEFRRSNQKKSGMTQPGAVFLFLSPAKDLKEWEALFVHEFHHAVRMDRLNRPIESYTLLDSIVFEGLAEHAVEEYCGQEYVSQTSKLYAEAKIMLSWHQHFQPNLRKNKNEPIHDQLLYGKKYVPPMMGYTLGYFLIEEFKRHYPFKTIPFIHAPSNTFITEKFQ